MIGKGGEGEDDYQWRVRYIRAATRFEGGDRGQVHWTCGLGSPNRAARLEGFSSLSFPEC
jgi:hypothetical protein